MLYEVITILETVDVSQDLNRRDFRFPVQVVVRPHLNFRGFAGTVASGAVKPGDRIRVLPSNKTSTVARVVTADGDLEEAFAPQARITSYNVCYTKLLRRWWPVRPDLSAGAMSRTEGGA